MAKVAFLGLGVMGYPMAGHLKTKGGHEVTVYNRTFAKAEKWVAQFGGKAAKTPKEAATGQDFEGDGVQLKHAPEKDKKSYTQHVTTRARTTERKRRPHSPQSRQNSCIVPHFIYH